MVRDVMPKASDDGSGILPHLPMKLVVVWSREQGLRFHSLTYVWEETRAELATVVG